MHALGSELKSFVFHNFHYRQYILRICALIDTKIIIIEKIYGVKCIQNWTANNYMYYDRTLWPFKTLCMMYQQLHSQLYLNLSNLTNLVATVHMVMELINTLLTLHDVYSLHKQSQLNLFTDRTLQQCLLPLQFVFLCYVCVCQGALQYNYVHTFISILLCVSCNKFCTW